MRPHSESYVSLLLLTFTTIFPLQSMSAEREGILMGFGLNTISPSGAQLGQGFGCGVQIIFVIPGRLQGDLGVSLFSSSQEPLTRIYVPGWRFREATSRISLIPVSMGVTYLLSGGRLRPYLGELVGSERAHRGCLCAQWLCPHHLEKFRRGRTGR